MLDIYEARKLNSLFTVDYTKVFLVLGNIYIDYYIALANFLQWCWCIWCTILFICTAFNYKHILNKTATSI